MRPIASLGFGAALALVAGLANGAEIDHPNMAASCDAPPDLTAIKPAEARTAAQIEHRKPLTIVAVGSSSTEGAGASAPGLSYPSQLAVELRKRFPATDIRVINRGKGGEDVSEELARLGRDVIAEHPELVIWQVGTNAVLRRDDLSTDRELIERGIGQLQASGSDVVLMDLQYAPRVLARPAYAQMEQLIARAAEHTHAGLFHRFEIMRYWHGVRVPGETPKAVGPDGLHMTDRGYGCLAVDLAEALARNWQGPPPPAQFADLTATDRAPQAGPGR